MASLVTAQSAHNVCCKDLNCFNIDAFGRSLFEQIFAYSAVGMELSHDLFHKSRLKF